MMIPNFTNMVIVDEEGKASPGFLRFLSQMVNELQSNLGTEGIKVTQLTTAQINELAAIAALGPDEAAVSNGNMFFDITTSDSTSMKTLIDGSLYTFTLT